MKLYSVLLLLILVQSAIQDDGNDTVISNAVNHLKKGEQPREFRTKKDVAAYIIYFTKGLIQFRCDLLLKKIGKFSYFNLKLSQMILFNSNELIFR